MARGIGLGVVAWVVLLCHLAPAAAGVYGTAEPPFPLDEQYFRRFQDLSLIPLRRVGTPEADLPWQKLTELTVLGLDPSRFRLPENPEDDRMTALDRLNLGVCLLRMRKYPESIEVLKIANRQAPKNFLVTSTLGTAYLQAGDYLKAGDCLSDAVSSAWGRSFQDLGPEEKKLAAETMKWNEAPFGWYALCEKYQLRLANERYKESRKDPRKGPLTFSKSLERLDAIFPLEARPGDPPIRFVGDSGKFEPGKMAASQKDRLPKNAISVVEQLLVWMPEDIRLYWLLGELLNAHGDIDSAKIVFGELLNKYAAKPEFQSLGKVEPMAMLPKFMEAYPEVGARLKALLDYVPPMPVDPGDNPPGGKKSAGPQPQPSRQPGTDEPGVGPLKLEWEQLLVAFGGGALAGMLALYQIREWRRPRQPLPKSSEEAR